MPSAAHAAVTFTVSPANDAPDAAPGDGECRTGPGKPETRCSLRAAIQEANALTGVEQLRLETGSFRPATALPVISGSVEIAGNGSRATELDGGGRGPVLHAAGGAVVIRGLTISGGLASDADGGGGVLNTGAIVTLDEVALRGNLASAPAGGARGGGVANRGGSMTILRSLITGNRAAPGGLGADGDGLGGGVYSDAPLTIAHSTIHANAALGTFGSAGFGGGLAAASSITLLRHVTLSDNTAEGGPGGDLWSGVSSGVELRDSIVTGGAGLAGAENCGGAAPLTSGRNLDSGVTCALGGGGTSSIDPLLAPLSANGGNTDARQPLSSSPAVAAASECALDRDQRGSLLPVATVCDLGAVEHSTDLLAGISASRVPVPAGAEVTLTLSAKSQGLDPVGSAGVQVDIPPRATFVRASSPAGACTGPPYNGAAAVFCPLGPARLGDAPAALITVRAPTSGMLTFTSFVSPVALSEAITTNDSATITIPVSTQAVQAAARGQAATTLLGDQARRPAPEPHNRDRRLGPAARQGRGRPHRRPRRRRLPRGPGG